MLKRIYCGKDILWANFPDSYSKKAEIYKLLKKCCMENTTNSENK